jgi:hypothetical protein
MFQVAQDPVPSSSIQFHLFHLRLDPVGSSEAKELRLVSQLAADGPAAQADALALAERIAAQSPVAVRTLVRSLRRKQEEGAERAERDEMLNMLEISDIIRHLSNISGIRLYRHTMTHTHIIYTCDICTSYTTYIIAADSPPIVFWDMHFRKARWCIPTWTVTGDIQNTHLSHLFIFQRIPRISLQSQFDETCLLGRGSLCNSAGLEAALWREADATWIFLNMGRTCPLSQSKSSKFQNDPTSKIVCLNELEMILIEHHILFLSVVHLVL